jgi:hypothetical protein
LTALKLAEINLSTEYLRIGLDGLDNKSPEKHDAQDDDDGNDDDLDQAHGEILDS